MKILLISPKPPWPIVDGGCFASHSLISTLVELGHDLKVLSYQTKKHPGSEDHPHTDLAKKVDFERIAIDTKMTFSRMVQAGLGFKSIQMIRFFNQSVRKRLMELLESDSFDLVIFDGLMSAIYFHELRKKFQLPYIYRSHNIEYDLLRDLPGTSSETGRRIFWTNLIYELEANKLRKLERYVWHHATETWSISKDDMRLIKEHGRCAFIPFEVSSSNASPSEKRMSIFHIGAMDWNPNYLGIQWFITDVWSALLKEYPDLELHLAGKGIEDRSLPVAKNVHIHPKVEDSSTFMNQYELMIVPIFHGSGIRIKILEALSLGKFIVSTKEGAKGLNTGDHPVMLASNRDEMIHAIRNYFSNPQRPQINEAGLKYVAKNHGRHCVEDAIETSFNQLKSEGLIK